MDRDTAGQSTQHNETNAVEKDEKSSGEDDYETNAYATEQVGRQTTPGSKTALKRRLGSRHMQMIAFGGSIGTGLFIGSGGVLSSGGPGFLMIDFILVGIMLYCVVMSLGEMAAVLPVSGSFASYSSRFIDPAWGFAMGYNYWMQWFVVLPLELVAASIVLDFWPGSHDVTKGVYILIFILAITFINLFGVRGYGEWEFFASMIKIITVIGFIILAIVIDCGCAPNGKYLGATTWHNPGAFNNGFKGFSSVFVTASFAFAGTELIGLAAAETANPRKEIPKAAKQIIWRILIFYILSLFLITLIVPYTDPRLEGTSSYDARASPFVIAIEIGKIKVLPSIMNAVILISVLSVGNSSVFGASRTLCSLAQAGQAPRIFAYIDRQGRPLPAVILSLCMGCLAFVIYAAESSVVFNWLLALSGLSTIFSWGSICACHIQFRRAWKYNGHSVDELPWKSPVGVVGAIFGVAFNILVIILQFYIAAFPIGAGSVEEQLATPSQRVNAFFLAFLAAPVVLVFFIFWKVFKRTSFVRLDEIDITTGRMQAVPLEVLRREREEARQQPIFKKIFNAII
ncbi:putative GAP1-amino acid transport protein [Meira miltonrushii]|uniref:Putative GAP1-amino acid transport protein n=1 Tax=Meira miltonrushii TaxID=1280837 RepID=A0A316VIQ1_9BASI|nr:putative GAP1-amino acid transport protein [Meira miltonrushii]PWN35891.1 putative GAP1-amino acid transport protein [Meira miltonrushii]